jgi:hypothetical protein
MPKANLKLATTAIVNRTVTPRRPPNADLRTREHLTEAEVERLMDAARKNRWGWCGISMLVAYRHGFASAPARSIIRAYLGHRNTQNTTRYTALAPQRFKEFFRDGRGALALFIPWPAIASAALRSNRELRKPSNYSALFRKAATHRPPDQLCREARRNRPHTSDRNFQIHIHRCADG